LATVVQESVKGWNRDSDYFVAFTTVENGKETHHLFAGLQKDGYNRFLVQLKNNPCVINS
jgi:hypothetical protein